MMKYKPSQAYYKEFTTSRFSSGAAYDATGTPVVTANRNGTDDGAFALTAANIDTGRYKITGTVPAGYADGDIVNVTVAATVDAVAAKANVDTFLVVTSREADIYARVGAPAGASIAADLVVIDNFVDDLEGRLTATRAGYLDNLSAGATALASVCTEARLAELDAANLPTDVAAVKGDTAATLSESQSHPTLAEMEATTVLAKEATLANGTYGLSALNTDIDAIKAKTDNLPEGFKKNAAFNNFMFLMVDSTDNKTGKTGLTITATRSIDGAAFASCANSASEVGSGFYKINLAATDRNGDMVTYKFDGGSTANVRTITIKSSL